VNSRISSYFFFFLLLLASVAAFIVVMPFLAPLVVAAATSVILHPVYVHIKKYLHIKTGRSFIASAVTVVLFLLVVIIPVFLVTGKIYSEVQGLYALLTDESGRSQVIDNLNAFSQSVSNTLFGIFPAYSFDSLNITEYFKNALEWVFANLDRVFGGLAKVAGYAFVFLLALFYFLKDGRLIVRNFVSWSPLLDTHDEFITNTLKKAIQSVFAGTVVVSLIQGLLTGIGFALFGIPAPAVWGSIAAVAAFIPGIGTSLVILPGVLYLGVFHGLAPAIGLMVWGIIAVGLVDNVLGPLLIKRGINVHPFIILVSVLGGLVVFGIIGFLLGPLILAFLFALLEIYRQAFSHSPVPRSGADKELTS
jgi:predicted PurR-regulated permease PerM